MEEVENNLFRKKAKVKLHPKIWTTLKTLLLIATTIFVLPIVIEDVKSSNGYFWLVISMLISLVGKATEIADTPLSSLTIGKFICVLLLYKSFCRFFFSYEKNTPD